MNIVVLNGSPKGELSVTLQYVRYAAKKFPAHSFQFFSIAQSIRKLEKDVAAFGEVITAVKEADAVLWAFPLYFFLVSSQYKRFIELIFERNQLAAFQGKYTASLSTSIHFFDHSAHNYIHAICDDLQMKYVGAY
jgi:NAD(P)H-dependent FMN reductase